MKEGLEMWVVYEKPTDYPNSYISREWIGDAATQNLIIAPTLEKLNEIINVKLGKDTFIQRDHNDDPCILGTWI